MISRKQELFCLQKDFKPGTIINDRSEVKSYIDLGGMGYLFKGYYRKLHRDVAIKILKDRWVSDKERQNDFLIEATEMVKVNHQYVGRVYDAGEYKGHYYLVMDYIEGKNLYALMQRKNRLNPAEAMEMMVKLSEGVDAVHKQGIAHRDIKPANIMINEHGDPILIDFGIAKSRGPDDSSTQTNLIHSSVTGTPGFIAPECYQTKKLITPAVDIFSLGKTFCYLLTGTTPKNGGDARKFLKEHSENSTRICNELGALIDRMIDSDPSRRIPNGGTVRDELMRIRVRLKKRPLRTLLVVFACLSAALTFVLASYYQLSNRQEWTPRPRVTAVIPIIGSDKYSALLYEIANQIRYDFPYYEVVDRKNIDSIIGELELSKDGWLSKEKSARVGHMAGAHIFIILEVGSHLGTDIPYVNAYDVETTALLASKRITPEQVADIGADSKLFKNVVAQLMDDIAERLVFRTRIESIGETGQVILEHGMLYGARAGMKLRVLDRNDESIGLLAITETDTVKVLAKVISGETILKAGLRVEEVKDGNR